MASIFSFKKWMEDTLNAKIGLQAGGQKLEYGLGKYFSMQVEGIWIWGLGQHLILLTIAWEVWVLW